MDKDDIRVPKYIVKTLAEKLRVFIEDKEKSFKFHPWQVTSTLNKIQKSIHSGLPERAIHHLHDTGAAHEIFKFSNQNEKSIKIGKVKEYLYSHLGLDPLTPRSACENGCQIICQESQTFDALRRNRIFEIRRLVDAIIQQLEQTGKMNGDGYYLQPYNWNKLSSPLRAPKQEMLAHCTYSCCLFHRYEQRAEKKRKAIRKLPKSPKTNFIKRNIRTAAPKLPYRRPTPQNTLSKSHLSPRNGLKLLKPKKMVESTTQTNTWSLKTPPRESLLDDVVVDVSNNEESMETESDFYCKSDTLNDASMITEEVASEFAQEVVHSDVKNEKSVRKCSKSLTRSKTQDRSVSIPEQKTKTNTSDNFLSNELEMDDNCVSSLKSVRLEVIGNTDNLSMSDEMKPIENNFTKSKSVSKRNGENNNASRSKSIEIGDTATSTIKSKSATLEVIQNSASCSKSVESVANKNSTVRSKSTEAAAGKNSIHSKSAEESENKVVRSKSLELASSQISATHSKSTEMKTSENNLTNSKKDNSVAEHISDVDDEKKCEIARTNYLTHIFSSIKRGSFLRCKTSLQESIGDKFDDGENIQDGENIAGEQPNTSVTDAQENGINDEETNPDNILKTTIITTNSSMEADEEKKDEIPEKLSIADTLKTGSKNSFESILTSDNETTYCPKSSSEAATDEESERSSIKENDNVSLEYSSHWTAEYSSTEASDPEDEEFKERFKEYKRSLLEDDEGIAASCEDEISFVTERHAKEIPAMSSKEEHPIEVPKMNRSISPSYDEETSYVMYTETSEENPELYEQVSCSMNSRENESYEESYTEHSYSNENGETTSEKASYDADRKDSNDNAASDKDASSFEERKTTENHGEAEILIAKDSEKTEENEELVKEDSCHMDTQTVEDVTRYHEETANNEMILSKMHTGENNVTSYEEVSGCEKVNESSMLQLKYDPSSDMETQENAPSQNQELLNKNDQENKDNTAPSEVLSDEPSQINENDISSQKQILDKDTLEDIEEVASLNEMPAVNENSETSSAAEISVKELSQVKEDDEEEASIKEITEISEDQAGLHEDISVQSDTSVVKVNSPELCEKVLMDEQIDADNAELKNEGSITNSEINVEQSEDVSPGENVEVNGNNAESEECGDQFDEIAEENESTLVTLVTCEDRIEEVLEADEKNADTESTEIFLGENKDGAESEEAESEKKDPPSVNTEANEASMEFLKEDNQENGQNVESSEDKVESCVEDIEESSDPDTQINELNDEETSLKDDDNQCLVDSADESQRSNTSKVSNENAVLKEEEIPQEETGQNIEDNETSCKNISDEDMNENEFESEVENVSINELDPKTHEEDTSEKEDPEQNEQISNEEESLHEDIEEDISGMEDVQTEDKDPSSDKIPLVVEESATVTEDETAVTEENTALEIDEVRKQKEDSDEDLSTKRLLKVLSLTDTQPFEEEDVERMDDNLLEIVDEDGWNMLHLAASKGLDKFTMKLLQHGLSTEDLTGCNNSPLQLAIMNNNLKCCQILLKHGATLSTEEGLFDEDFVENAGEISSPIKELLGSYKSKYMKVQRITEVLNQFGSKKKDLSGPFSKDILQILADVAIENDEENVDEQHFE